MEYLVIFLNYNGEELYKTMVKEGETAVYEGPVPKKGEETFAGWNKSLKNITDNLIVTAVFEKPKKGTLRLGAMTFVENEKSVHVIEQAVISNEDLYKNKETDIER
ncbi:MAG: hypothetical protein IJ220_06255 [Clostridia bacterium]|nr:hypothetical protein [Clostridia bacterium]